MCNDPEKLDPIWESDPDSWKYDEDDDVVQARQEEESFAKENGPVLIDEDDKGPILSYQHSEEAPF